MILISIIKQVINKDQHGALSNLEKVSGFKFQAIKRCFGQNYQSKEDMTSKCG